MTRACEAPDATGVFAPLANSTRLVQTETRIELVSGKDEKPKTKAVYKYIGCYVTENPEEDYVKSDSPVSAMTIHKCYTYCHGKENDNPKLAGKLQFFLLKNGKECRCLHYIIKNPSGNSQANCKEKCQGKSNEICGGPQNDSVYVMMDCAILPPSESEKVAAKQMKERLANAKKAVEESEAQKLKALQR